MAGREVNCEYCRVVVFEVDRFCVGCGAPRKAFPDEPPTVYSREPISYSSDPVSWHSVCSTAIMMSDSSSTWTLADTNYVIHGGEMST